MNTPRPSEQLQARIQRFDDFITATASVVAQIDERHFVPEILPVVRQLGSACEQAFLPNIDDNGHVSLPGSARHGEGFGVIPLLYDSETLHVTASLGMPTHKRIADAALEYNVKPSKLYEVCRKEVKDRENAKPFHTLSVTGDAAALVNNYFGTNKVDGIDVFLVSRPCVVTGSRVYQLPEIDKGVVGVHELTHAQDKQNAPLVDTVDNVEATQSGALVWLEERAYHTGFGALMSADESFSQIMKSGDLRKLSAASSITASVELLRRTHAQHDQPFGHIPEVVEFLFNEIDGKLTHKAYLKDAK